MLDLDTDMVVLDMDILIMVKLQLPLSIIFPYASKSSKALCQLAVTIQYPALGR